MSSFAAKGCDSSELARWRRVFLVMCMCFGLILAVVTTPIPYASSSLSPGGVGLASNALLYGSCCLASVFIGPPIEAAVGPKGGLVIGMALYVVYVVCFALATLLESWRWLLALSGALSGGLACGTLWTCQGSFLVAVTREIVHLSGERWQAVTSQLSSQFALWYLGHEVLWKIVFTLLQEHTDLSDFTLFLLYGALAAGATLAFALSPDVPSGSASQSAGSMEPTHGPWSHLLHEAATPRWRRRASMGLRLWSRPQIWLLSGLNMAFGFCAAWINGYVNAVWLPHALHDSFLIGYLSALICLVATLSSQFYGHIAEPYLGGKVPVVAFGAACFFAVAVMSLVSAPVGQGPGGWHWGILALYVCLGLGRGVFESTYRGLFADLFPGEDSAGAFANANMQSTMASAAGFALGASGAGNLQVWFLLVSSLLSVPGLCLAASLAARDARKATPEYIKLTAT